MRYSFSMKLFSDIVLDLVGSRLSGKKLLVMQFFHGFLFLYHVVLRHESKGLLLQGAGMLGVLSCVFLVLSSLHLLKTVFAALAFFNSFQISSALAAGIRMGRSKKRKQLPRNVWVTKLNHLETMIECTHDMVPIGRFHCQIAQRHQGFLSPLGEASSKRQSCTMLEFQWLKPSPSYTCAYHLMFFWCQFVPTHQWYNLVYFYCTILYIFTVYPKEMQRIWWVQISWTSRKNLQVSPLTKHVGEAQLYVFCRSRGVDDWPIDWWGFCIEGGVLVDLPDLAAWLAPGSCKMLGACRRYTFQKGLIGSGFILDPNRKNTWIYLPCATPCYDFWCDIKLQYGGPPLIQLDWHFSMSTWGKAPESTWVGGSKGRVLLASMKYVGGQSDENPFQAQKKKQNEEKMRTKIHDEIMIAMVDDFENLLA